MSITPDLARCLQSTWLAVRQCECPPPSVHLLSVSLISRWSSDSQGDSWHGWKVKRIPSSSPLCVIFYAGPVVMAVFCRSNGPHKAVHMCFLVSRSISVDREGCVPVSGADSGVKHVFFVVLARWFKSSMFAATLSPCQGKHCK